MLSKSAEGSYRLSLADSRRPPCIDLDGTLVNTDLLVEARASLLVKNPLLVFLMLFWLPRGRAEFKQGVACRATIRPEALPYNMDLVAYLRDQHRQGREIVLADGTRAF